MPPEDPSPAAARPVIVVEASEPLHNGWTTLTRVSLRSASGAPVVREIESHGDGAAVLAFDPARRTAMLVRQLRVAAFVAAEEASTLEAIAGIVEDRDPATTAAREALEEAGLHLAALEAVGWGWSMPGVSTERVHLFLAEYTDASRLHAGGGLAHENEEIEAVELPLADLARALAGGTLHDLKTIALAQALMLRRPELFG